MTKKSSKGASGCFKYVIALGLIGLGVCCPILPGLYRYWHEPYVKSFLVPGSVEVVLPRSGAYTLWHEYRTVFNGKSYSASTNLPSGLQVVLKSRVTGASFALQQEGEYTFTIGRTAARGVGSFSIPTPGRYLVSVSGPVHQPLVFSFREDWLFAVVGQTFLLFLVGAVLVASGGVLLVVFIWRSFR